MKVKNINGTSDNNCSCGSWLEHWKKFSGQTLPQYCPESKCINKPEVGAHVQKDSSTDSNWYIIPLCKQCNAKKGAAIIVSDNIKLVSANKSATCEKGFRSSLF